jgi:hypothetical protein
MGAYSEGDFHIRLNGRGAAEVVAAEMRHDGCCFGWVDSQTSKFEKLRIGWRMTPSEGGYRYVNGIDW